MEITLTHYLLLAGALFLTGMVGFIVRRNAIIMMMCVELMLCSTKRSQFSLPPMRCASSSLIPLTRLSDLSKGLYILGLMAPMLTSKVGT